MRKRLRDTGIQKFFSLFLHLFWKSEIISKQKMQTLRRDTAGRVSGAQMGQPCRGEWGQLWVRWYGKSPPGR